MEVKFGQKEIREIWNILLEAQKEDDKMNEAINKFCEVMCPDSYAPFYNGVTGRMMEALLPIIGKEIKEEFEYFLYEADNFYPECKITLANDEEVIIKDENDAIDYIISQYKLV